jgi:hypothetical protein
MRAASDPSQSLVGIAGPGADGWPWRETLQKAYQYVFYAKFVKSFRGGKNISGMRNSSYFA